MRIYNDLKLRALFLLLCAVAADGKLYLPREDGDIFVVKAGAKFALLGTNPIGQLLMSTPALSGGMMLVRAEHDVFAIGKSGKASARFF